MSAFLTARRCSFRRCVKDLFVLCMFEGNLCRECGTLYLAFFVGGRGP